MSKNEKKILTQKLLLKLKNLRKPDQSRIKFYNMQPFKTQVLVYFDREITKIWFSSLSMFSNNWPYVNDFHPHCTEDPALKDSQSTISSPAMWYISIWSSHTHIHFSYTNRSGFQQLKENGWYKLTYLDEAIQTYPWVI